MKKKHEEDMKNEPYSNPSVILRRIIRKLFNQSRSIWLNRNGFIHFEFSKNGSTAANKKATYFSVNDFDLSDISNEFFLCNMKRKKNELKKKKKNHSALPYARIAVGHLIIFVQF